MLLTRSLLHTPGPAPSSCERVACLCAVRVAGGQGLASVLAVFELVGTLLLGRDNEDDWEDVTDESCDMDASMATFIVRRESLSTLRVRAYTHV